MLLIAFWASNVSPDGMASFSEYAQILSSIFDLLSEYQWRHSCRKDEEILGKLWCLPKPMGQPGLNQHPSDTWRR